MIGRMVEWEDALDRDLNDGFDRELIFEGEDALREGTCEYIGHDWLSNGEFYVCGQCGAMEM